MQERGLYTIDLTKIKGNGTIKCPKCGVGLSPDDTSEEVYTVIEPVVEEDRLNKIVLQCNRCKSKINLIGFDTLNEDSEKHN